MSPCQKMSKCHNSIKSQKYNMYKDVRVRVYNVIYTTWISIVSACFSLLHFVSLCFILPFHIPMALSPGLGRWQSSGSQVVPAGRPSRVSFTEQDLQLSLSIPGFTTFRDIGWHGCKCFWCLMNSHNILVFHGFSLFHLLYASRFVFYLIWLLLLMGLRWPIEGPGSDQLPAIAE